MKITIEISESVASVLRKSLRARNLGIVCVVMTLAIGTAVVAAPDDVPLTNFSAGTTISASQVNANFDEVERRIMNLETRTGRLETYGGYYIFGHFKVKDGRLIENSGQFDLNNGCITFRDGVQLQDYQVSLGEWRETHWTTALHLVHSDGPEGFCVSMTPLNTSSSVLSTDLHTYSAVVVAHRP